MSEVHDMQIAALHDRHSAERDSQSPPSSLRAGALLPCTVGAEYKWNVFDSCNPPGIWLDPESVADPPGSRCSYHYQPSLWATLLGLKTSVKPQLKLLKVLDSIQQRLYFSQLHLSFMVYLACTARKSTTRPRYGRRAASLSHLHHLFLS